VLGLQHTHITSIISKVYLLNIELLIFLYIRLLNMADLSETHPRLTSLRHPFAYFIAG
jgi:hypothetical protein